MRRSRGRRRQRRSRQSDGGQACRRQLADCPPIGQLRRIAGERTAESGRAPRPKLHTQAACSMSTQAVPRFKRPIAT